MRLSQYERSVIPACDFDNFEEYEKLLLQTHDLPRVGSYKIGFLLMLQYGLPYVVKFTRRYTNKPLIFDKQKFGYETDDDLTVEEQIRRMVPLCKEAGVDAIITFPLIPGNLELWVKTCHKYDLEIIVGAHMTSEHFTTNEGWIWPDRWVEHIYEKAAEMGVNKFVIPGNKLRASGHYIEILSEVVKDDLEFIVPGFYGQSPFWPKSNGIREFMEICPYSWHPVFGPIDGIENVGLTAQSVVEQLYPNHLKQVYISTKRKLRRANKAF